MLYNKLTLKQQMLWRILGILIAVVLMTIPIVVFGLAFNECDKVHIFVAYSFLVAVLIGYTAMLCAWHKNDKRVYKWREHLLVKNDRIYHFYFIFKLIVCIAIFIAALVLVCVDWNALYTNIALIAMSGVGFVVILIDLLIHSQYFNWIKNKKANIYIY